MPDLPEVSEILDKYRLLIIDAVDKKPRLSHPTPYVRSNINGYFGELEAGINKLLIEARIDGMKEITAIGRERLDNDSTYSLDAWIEDSEVYLEARLKASLKEGSDE